jgi:hypothetical protein
MGSATLKHAQSTNENINFKKIRAMASYTLISEQDKKEALEFLDWIRINAKFDAFELETFANGMMKLNNIIDFGSGGMDTSDESKALPIQDVRLSLRDKFAMNAINGYTSAHSSDGEWTTIGCEADIAEMSYKIADAMLKQREQ